MIDWNSNNILKINNDIDCFYNDSIDESKIDDLRKKIEPWLTAIFQSEHFSLLIGAGLPIGLTYLADVKAQGMDSAYSGEIDPHSGNLTPYVFFVAWCGQRTLSKGSCLFR